ncbi:hypothetical protein BH23CHL7_BH23CHL7_19000 [soil metagenome]
MALIDELAQAAQSVADGAGKSVVRIGRRWRGGSGFIVGPGIVLTNAHNTLADTLPVTFADGRRAEATVRGTDVDGDLAALSVDTGDLPAVEWTAEPARLGSAVFGVSLTGAGQVRVTVGFVSGVGREFRGPRGRRIAGGLEHTAPLAPGSSGSPLVGVDGKVVGINTNRLGDGFYLALPASDPLASRAADLGRGQSTERPRLGIGLAPARVARRMRRAVGLEERDGLLVRAVEDGSPAASAGIAEGDLIVSAAGRPLADADDLYDVLGDLGSGQTVELGVVRGANERAVTVRLGATGEQRG